MSGECHGRLLSTTILVLSLLTTYSQGANQSNFPHPELFPFGVGAGDLPGPRGDDSASSRITLGVPLTFLGTEYSRIVVNSNGVLSFEMPFTFCCAPRTFPIYPSPLIALFWHDFDPTLGGSIYYRQTNNSQELQLFHIHLSSALNAIGLGNFSSTLLFVATWDQVPEFFGSALLNNTLQVVLATDSVQTIAVFIYRNISWGERAQIGFNAGDGLTSFIFPEALSDQTLSIDERSNVGEPGVFVYRINELPLLKLSGILPFGANVNDLPGPPGDDSASKPLTLRVQFPFFGRNYSKIIVNSNGVLSFDATFANCCPPRDFPLVSPPLIAPFWHDVDLTSSGSEGVIYYRQTNDSIYLQLVHILLMNVDDIGDLVNFFPKQIFIATWDLVPQFGRSTSISNTFQVILSTDGIQTVAIFIYFDIRWGEGAQIGFNAGDGYTSFTLPEALSDQTRSVDVLSNVGELGVFVYRIDIPPDQAHDLTVESTAATSIPISWKPPTATSLRVLFYLINANSNMNSIADDILQVNTTHDVTFYNVTGLLPGTTYELTVVAVYTDGGASVAMSQASSSVTATTGFTVPALMCNAPVSSSGVITVTWSYIHTGGLPLTNLSISYTYSMSTSGSIVFRDSRPMNNTVLSISNVDTTSVMIPNLVAGAEYMFIITAENSIGSSSITCGPTSHIIGSPATPVFGDIMSGPNAGEVTITVMTPASGINGQLSDIFWFVVTPIHEGIEGESVSHLTLNYQSGTFETILIDGLDEGESYAFNATATNVYGSSQATTSVSTLAGRSNTNSGAVIIGGAVGGSSLLLLIIVLLLILILIKVVATRRGKTEIGNVESVLMNRVTSVRITRSDLDTEAIYEEPNCQIPRHFQQVARRESDVSLDYCPAYGVSPHRL